MNTLKQSPMANGIAKMLEEFRPLVVGNTVFIPSRERTSIDEICEVSGLDSELIEAHPNGNYFVIDCPDSADPEHAHYIESKDDDTDAEQRFREAQACADEEIEAEVQLKKSTKGVSLNQFIEAARILRAKTEAEAKQDNDIPSEDGEFTVNVLGVLAELADIISDRC